MSLTLTIIEENGLTVTDDRVVITVGASGPQGATGAAGVGVPAGGTTGQVLAKASNTNYDTQWVTGGGGGSGDVVGPASSVDGRAVLFDGITGRLIKQATAAPVLEGDARLTDARTPTAHKTSHSTGGTDALAPSDIGAAAAVHTHSGADITSGTVGTARLGSGTASISTYLRGDGTWAANYAATFITPCAANDYVPLFTQTGSASNQSPAATTGNSMNIGVMWWPVFIPTRLGVTGLAIEVTTANAGANAIIRLALFNDNGSGRPGTSIVQTTASLNTTGSKDLTFSSVNVGPGWVWAGARVEALDTAGANPTYRAVVVWPHVSTTALPTGTGQSYLLSTSGPITTATAIPDNPTTGTTAASSTVRPCLYMKVGTP